MAFILETSGNTHQSVADPVGLNLFTAANSTLLVLSIITTRYTRVGGAPTYGAITMTQAGTTESGTDGFCEVWYALNDDIPESVGISIDVPNTDTSEVSLVGVIFNSPTGKEAEFEVVDQNSGSATNPSVTVGTYTSPAVVVGGLFTGGGNIGTLFSDKTQLYKGDTGDEGYGAHYYLASSGTSTNMSWSYSTSDVYANVGVAFKEIDVTLNIDTFNDADMKFVTSLNGVLGSHIDFINSTSRE